MLDIAFARMKIDELVGESMAMYLAALKNSWLN